MQTYTTQMDAARKGIITPQMEIVAKKEYRTTEEIRQWVAEGKVAIPANKHHECLNPEGVGSMLRTKINVNLGVSRDCKDYNVEMQKVMSAVNMGAEAIMDLSSHGNTQPFRQKLTHECPVMIGTVPVYDSVIHYQRDLAELTAQDFIDVVRLHAEDGVDFVTLHCGITRKTIEQIRKHKRKMNIVSRGGSLVFAWMSMTGNENPFYEHFDEICEICAEHDVTISLGDACRPGCLADATDVCQIEELVRLGELTKRAWAHNVQVMVEGPGHVPLNQVAANMEVQKSICMGAPFYVLGPLVTDIAPGYDRGSRQRCSLPVLCDPRRASGSAQRGRCEAGHRGLQDRCPRRRYRQGHPPRPGHRRQDGRCPPRAGLGCTVRLRTGPGDRQGHPRRPPARGRPQRHLQHVRQVLCRAQHE